MRLLSPLVSLVTGLISSTALAAPWGPTAAVGGVVTPAQERGEATIEPLVGPVVQAGVQVGDWFNNQFQVQYSWARGGVDYGSVPVDGSASLRTLAAGYELRLDVFGKTGRGGFTPFVGGGFFLGLAGLNLDAHSDDEDLQEELEAEGVASNAKDLTYLEFHAVVGLRYRLNENLGLRLDAAWSTYGGFLGTWQPKLGVDWVVGSKR